MAVMTENRQCKAFMANGGQLVKHDAYESNGIFFDRKSLTTGKKAIVRYAGLLHDSGASAVTLHFGYGDNWEGSVYVPMAPVLNGFEAEITWERSGIAQMAFVDAAGNWDNNGGRNYGFMVTGSRTAEKKPTAKDSAGKAEKKPTAKDSAGKAEKKPTAKASSGKDAAKTTAGTAGKTSRKAGGKTGEKAQ